MIRLFFLFVCLSFFNTNLAQSFVNETLQYDGETRSYEIYVPSTYDGSVSVPLMFSFHGGGGNIAENKAINDLSSLAETDNFIAVYPQALADPNDDGETLWIHKDPTSIDDVWFIDALIDSISNDYQIDLNRVYACGYSHGGEFTLSLACRLNNRIAAIGVVARTMQTYTYNNCSPVHPTGVMTILGTDDFISNYNGVYWQGTQYYLSAEEMHSYWANYNNCNNTATVTDIPNTNTSDGTTVERHTWSTSEGCEYVEELKVIGGGHDWPGTFGNMDINATEEIWQFVSKYDLNGLMACSTASISDKPDYGKKIVLYPNPSKDQITVQTSFLPHKNYSLLTLTGKQVKSGVLKSSEPTINISSLPSNIYLLKLHDRYIKFVKL